MDRIYLFLIRNDVWIYIVSTMALFWYLFELVRAVRALRQAMFNLERETATNARNHALSFIIFFATVIVVVFYVNRYIAPTLPDELLHPAAPAPSILTTPLAPPTPLGPVTAGGGELVEVPALAPTATFPGSGPAEVITDTQEVEESEPVVGTPTPFAECIPELMISEPLNGSVVFRRATFRGTANTGELHQYVIELNGPQTTGTWAPISPEPMNQPVMDGDLGEADLSQWMRGPYRVRLRALDANGGELGVCTIQIILDT